LDVVPVMCVEDETCPADVHAVSERAAGVRIDSYPLFIIEGAGRGRCIDEGRCAPGQARAAEGALADGHRVGRCGAIEAKTGVVGMALAVERYGGIAAGVVDASCQALNAGNQSPKMARVRADTTPGQATIIGEVGSRVRITQSAAGCPRD